MLKRVISMCLTVVIMLSSIGIVASAEEKNPFVILKFDDMSCNTPAKLDAFEQMVILLMEEEVVGSFGVIGAWCQEGDTETRKESFNIFWDNVKTYISCGMEIWSHGWNHDSTGQGQHEFNQMFSDEDMKERFGKVIDIVAENTGGYQITTFGAPYNRTNDACAKMVNENYPQITAVFMSMNVDNTVNKNFNAVVIDTLYGIDGTFDGFMSKYTPGSEVIALQGHPADISEETREEVRKIIRYFKEQGSIFMTPSQYAEYVRNLEQYRADDSSKIALLCDNKLLMSDSAPYIENGRTMVPVRIISENLDAKVSWDEATSTVTAERYGTEVEIKIDSNTAIVNGEEITLDAPARIRDGRTMVPIRFIAETFGADVSWDNARSMVIISQ